MELTYTQFNTYEIICNEEGISICCYICTTTNIYGNKVYISCTTVKEQIPLEKMQKIVEQLKG